VSAKPAYRRSERIQALRRRGTSPHNLSCRGPLDGASECFARACGPRTAAGANRALPRDRSCRREPRPLARVRRAPRQLALCLCVRRAAGFGHHHEADLAREEPPDEARHTGPPRSSPDRRCARTATRRGLCATNRRTPSVCAAASRSSVPSVRRRFVSSKSRSLYPARSTSTRDHTSITSPGSSAATRLHSELTRSSASGTGS
jgi:hypothetical protein